MNKKLVDGAAIVAAVALLGSGISWIISVEHRMTSRLTLSGYYADQENSKQKLRGEIKTLKSDMVADVRGLRDRLNSFQWPACPPCPIARTPHDR